MSWLEINLNELEQEKQQQQGRSKFDIEPGVYEVTLRDVYIAQTQSGATYFGLRGVTGESPNDQEINLDGFSVERMVKNKDGQAKMSNGRHFTGVLLLDDLAKCIGKNVNQLMPVQGVIEMFGRQEQVGLLKDFYDKQVLVGIRDRIYEYNGEKRTKKELVGICCTNDGDCLNKLKKRIEKKPVIEEKPREKQKQEATSSEIPF
jgi:hypothetical protein